MEYIVRQGEAEAVIELDGAYVAILKDAGRDILYPKQLITLADGSSKWRGGSHVCLPQFGPGGTTGLAQHGYGRLRAWQLVDYTQNEVTLALSGEGVYSGLQSQLTYRLDGRSFESTLSLHNTGNNALVVAPAFHPYFACNQSFQIDQVTYDDADALQGTLFIDGANHVLANGWRDVTVSSRELQRWALWTDYYGQYICIEPTLGGNVFIEDMNRAETMTTGETRQYSYCIQW